MLPALKIYEAILPGQIQSGSELTVTMQYKIAIDIL
jgi:hypothetical protein